MKNMKKTIFLILITLLSFNPLISCAQSDSSSVNVDSVLADLSDLIQNIKTNNRDRKSKNVTKKLIVIKRKLDKAVKLTPPSTCNDLFGSTLITFYNLVVNLSKGITCGPDITPPLDSFSRTLNLTTDCTLPPEQLSSQVQVNVFSGSYEVYENARALFSEDENANGVSDVCE